MAYSLLGTSRSLAVGPVAVISLMTATAIGVSLHLSEVKGSVMDKLNRENFPQHLSGKVYLDHYFAVNDLIPEPEYNL